MSDTADDGSAAGLERELLGGTRRYTRREVAERAGVSVEQARLLWRALGFADVGDDNPAFTDRDIEALVAVQDLLRRGVIDEDTQLAMTRAMGQSLARLAEWQVSAITKALAKEGTFGPDGTLTAAHELVPVMEGLIGYVWRRHLAASGGRALANPDEVDARSLAVGFADLVGFTSLTRHVDETELARLVELFERLASDVVAEHAGRVIKTVGDEVMFTADDAATAAEIGLTMLEQAHEVEELPDLRVGLAFGGVLSRLGDVYGEPVNIAARLTSIARPGSVLIDRELAAALEGDDRFRTRRVPPRPVRGYALLQPVRLRRADDTN
ncbi:MAG: adenylate cyclase [Frankiaceae bacterium]|nr:adenylate cyclase [Frankiaceae bacterium]